MTSAATPDLDRAVAPFRALSDATRLAALRSSYYQVAPDVLAEAHDLVVQFRPRVGGTGRALRVVSTRGSGKTSSRCCS